MLKVIFFIVILNLFNFLNAKEKKIDKLVIAFYSKTNLMLNEQRVKVALELWKKDFLENEAIDIQVKFYDNLSLMTKDFLGDKKIDIVAFKTFYVLENKETFRNSFRGLWNVIFEEQFTNYVLVQKKEFKKELFLKNRIIGYKKDHKESLLWLDTISLKKYKKESKDLVAKFNTYKKDSSVLIDNYFGKTDMSIVSMNSWNIMKELNPNISKKLELVKTSPKIFMENMGMFRKTFPKELISKVVNSANKMIYNKESKNIYEILNISAFKTISNDDYYELREFYDNFKKLKNEKK